MSGRSSNARYPEPPAKKGSGQKSAPGYQRTVWVNYSLSPSEKARLKEVDYDALSFAVLMDDCRSIGYKFVASPRNERGFFGSSLIGVSEECPNLGYGLSGEGGSPESANLSLQFKLSVYEPTAVWVVETSPDDDFR